jgi:hypothetical protein
MILRRFNQHVQEQDWFAVSLEFAVVVIGFWPQSAQSVKKGL